MSYENIRPRDIVTADPRYTDQKERKRRPLLVVSQALFHQNSSYAVCVGITTSIQSGTYLIPLPKKEIEHGRLDYESQIMCHRIVTLKQSELSKSIGRVTPAFYEKIVTKLKKDVLGP